jgi:hypothetical protein
VLAQHERHVASLPGFVIAHRSGDVFEKHPHELLGCQRDELVNEGRGHWRHLAGYRGGFWVQLDYVQLSLSK